jgi:hypothetical protein
MAVRDEDKCFEQKIKIFASGCPAKKNGWQGSLLTHFTSISKVIAPWEIYKNPPQQFLGRVDVTMILIRD